MRISDWSSDVCSSDLIGFENGQVGHGGSAILKLSKKKGAEALPRHPDSSPIAGLCFRQGSLGLSNDRLEGVAFMHCDIGQDLAIQFDTRKLQTVHELAIGQAFHAYGGFDALNPERTEARPEEGRVGEGFGSPCRS